MSLKFDVVIDGEKVAEATEIEIRVVGEKDAWKLSVRDDLLLLTDRIDGKGPDSELAARLMEKEKESRAHAASQQAKRDD